MQGFGAQTHLFSEVTEPQQFEQTKKEVSNGPQKVTDAIFVNPPPEGLLNNANFNLLRIADSRLAGLESLNIFSSEKQKVTQIAVQSARQLLHN